MDFGIFRPVNEPLVPFRFWHQRLDLTTPEKEPLDEPRRLMEMNSVLNANRKALVETNWLVVLVKLVVASGEQYFSLNTYLR